MNCPLCQSKSKFVFKIHGYDLMDCTVCSHRFVKLEVDENHTTAIYDDTYFYNGGAGYSDYALESRLLRKRGRMYAKKIAKFSAKKGKVLDVGAAAGYLLEGFIDEGWIGSGLEPNRTMVENGREKLGLDMQLGTLENFETSEKYNLISMIQVVAHFWEQKKAFENARNLLEKNGLLLVETWDRQSVSAKLFGRYWHEYSPPSVLHWFSLDGLTEFLKSLGFERIAKGRPSKKISGKHAKSLLKHRLGNHFLLNLIPENINFPYPSEDLFWALYRKI
ncbi:MAG: class I SAM-dependent methyltransferase [Bacteroidota bacterium]